MFAPYYLQLTTRALRQSSVAMRYALCALLFAYLVASRSVGPILKSRLWRDGPQAIAILERFSLRSLWRSGQWSAPEVLMPGAAERRGGMRILEGNISDRIQLRPPDALEEFNHVPEGIYRRDL